MIFREDDDRERFLSILELSKYIHLNPVSTRKGKKESVSRRREALGSYEWSTCRGYMRKSDRLDWVKYDDILGYAGGEVSFWQNGRFDPVLLILLDKN